MITPRDIPKPYGYDKGLHESSIIFLGNFISDIDEIIREKRLVYTKLDTELSRENNILEPVLWGKYQPDGMKGYGMKLTGLAQELFQAKSIEIALPYVMNGIPIDGDNWKRNYLAPLVKDNFISDKYMMILNALLKSFKIVYSKKNKIIGFGPVVKKKRSLIRNTGTKGSKSGRIETYDLSLEEVLEAEIVQGYVNPDIGDRNRDYAYSHTIRKAIEYKLFKWHRELLINWNKYNVAGNSRSTGKTMLAGFLAARELLSNKPGFGGRRFREIKYFIPDKANVGKQAFTYIKYFLDPFIYDLSNGKKSFKINEAAMTITCNITGNNLAMISLHGTLGESSGLGSSVGEGLACDFAIIDEAARIPDHFWTSFIQRAHAETEHFYIATTINKETPKDHWFYRLLIDGEFGREDVNSVRVTVDENELYTEKQREHIKSEVRRTEGEKEYFARMYCVVVDENEVFDLTGALISTDTVSVDSDERILAFDFGKKGDPAGLVLINLNRMIIEESIEIKSAQYLDQLKIAGKYKKKYDHITVIGDRTGVGEAVAEMDRDSVVDFWIKFTGQGAGNFHKDGFYTISKMNMVMFLQQMFDKRLIKVLIGNNSILIKQLQDFVKVESPNSEIVKYRGKNSTHDDLVASLLMAATYIYKVLGLHTKEKMEKYGSGIDFYLKQLYNKNTKKNTNLYHKGVY